MQSFIVEFWSRVFATLGRISVFALVAKFRPGLINTRFVDCWVLGHLVLALCAVVLAPFIPTGHLAGLALMAYGMLRVFEIAVYQTNVLLFDEYRAVRAGRPYWIEGYRRIVLLLLHNYAEIILWLGCTYTVLADFYDHKWTGGTSTVLGAVYSSFITMTTFGDFDLSPKSSGAAFVLLFHATVGLFMTLLSLARFISLIPAPMSRDPVELRQMAAAANTVAASSPIAPAAPGVAEPAQGESTTPE